MSMIKVDGLSFEYIRRDEDGNVESVNKAIDHVSLDVEKGDFLQSWVQTDPVNQPWPNISMRSYIQRKAVSGSTE
jgi:hypothetical protein